jgi:hypothetical protein
MRLRSSSHSPDVLNSLAARGQILKEAFDKNEAVSSPASVMTATRVGPLVPFTLKRLADMVITSKLRGRVARFYVP